VSHDQAAELLGLLEGTCRCHVVACGGQVHDTWPNGTTPSDELAASIRRQKPALLEILEGRRKVIEFQRRLKKLKGQS
jgi:hypothetical protein